MSQIRYASITPSLLARKGDAAPSLEMLPQRPSLFAARPPDPEEAPREAEPAPVTAEKRRRIVLMLSADEYERLGIAAAKAESSRHQVLRQAMEAHLARIAAARQCNCLGANGGGSGNCCS